MTTGLLVTAFYAIPVGLVAIWSQSGFGYDIKPQSQEWISTALLAFNSLASIIWLIFVFYAISQSKKHFVRFLSGIKESGSKPETHRSILKSQNNKMKAIFKETKGDYLTATIEINKNQYFVMDHFYGEKLKKNQQIEIELSVGVYSEEESWETMFSGNPDRTKSLNHIKGWGYQANGIITSITPDVMVDVGIAVLDAPITSNDQRLVGESISFKINRLDAYPA